MVVVYQCIVIASLLVFLGIILLNRRTLLPLPEAPSADGLPFVSVLVPVRNEERCLEACLVSLLGQDYPAFEVLVLDDFSSDASPAILRRLAARSGGRLRVLQGRALPEGWHGKSWACQQLGEQASGELLLFTDADTIHRPTALRRAACGLEVSRAEMLSLTPYQELGSFWERLVVPMVYVILVSFLPIRMVGASALPAFCFANGQFILFRRDAYLRIGGHGAVRGDLVEDVWLCRAMKRSGGRVAAYNGVDAVGCRMYTGFAEVWQGFSKNLFAGIGYSTPGLGLFILLSLLVYLVPLFLLAWALSTASFSLEAFWLPLLQVILALASRALVAGMFAQPASFVLLYPLSQLMLVAIAINSYREVRWGGGALWKGRRYDFS